MFKNIITEQKLLGLGIKCVYKSNNTFMKFLSMLLFLFNKNFMSHFTTHIPFLKKIYLPSNWTLYSAKTQDLIIKHELIHFAQWKKYKTLFTVGYVLLPLPIWWTLRYYWEREAYLVNYREGRSLNSIVDNLCGKNYLWAGSLWPGRNRTREWYLKRG